MICQLLERDCLCRLWNIKFVSWNVNGLRAWLKKVVMIHMQSAHSMTDILAVLQSSTIDYIKREEPDICCLQETKCDEDNIPEASWPTSMIVL